MELKQRITRHFRTPLAGTLLMLITMGLPSSSFATQDVSIINQPPVASEAIPLLDKITLLAFPSLPQASHLPPSLFYLLGLGLAGVGFAARKKNTQRHNRNT